jgi:hypothetical protein
MRRKAPGGGADEGATVAPALPLARRVRACVRTHARAHARRGALLALRTPGGAGRAPPPWRRSWRTCATRARRRCRRRCRTGRSHTWAPPRPPWRAARRELRALCASGGGGAESRARGGSGRGARGCGGCGRGRDTQCEEMGTWRAWRGGGVLCAPARCAVRARTRSAGGAPAVSAASRRAEQAVARAQGAASAWLLRAHFMGQRAGTGRRDDAPTRRPEATGSWCAPAGAAARRRVSTAAWQRAPTRAGGRDDARARLRTRAAGTPRPDAPLALGARRGPASSTGSYRATGARSG